MWRPRSIYGVVLNTESGHSITSEYLVDPITPPPELISTTLLGDVTECVATDFLAHRDSYVSDVTRLRMDVPWFEVTTRSIDRLISHLRERLRVPVRSTGQAQLLGRREPRGIRFLRFVRDRIRVDPVFAQIGIRDRIPDLARM